MVAEKEQINQSKQRSIHMKFSEMPYTRPDSEAVKTELQQLTGRLRSADSYEAARAVFLEQE